MKNVLLIGSELEEEEQNAPSHFLVRTWKNRGYYVILCILSGKARERYYETCQRVIFIDPPEHTGIIGKIKSWRYRLKKIRKIKEDNSIEVSISFLEGPDYINVLTRGKEKIVLSIRGTKAFDKGISGLMGLIRKKLLMPFLYSRADEIVCVAEALSKEMNTFFKISEDKLTTIYNFYENERIVAQSNEPLSPEAEKIFSKPVIVTSGRLHASKSHDSLVRILKKVKEKSDARLMILGDGELKGDLIALSAEMGLKVCDWATTQVYEDADVYLMGHQLNAFKFYRHSSMFALSSSWKASLMCLRKHLSAIYL